MDFKLKLIQCLSNKKSHDGYTMIELIVVMGTLVILSALALPSFINQANRARQVEAITYVGAMNRAQQIYQAQYDTFALDMESLGLGIPQETEFYRYSTEGSSREAISKAEVLTGSVQPFSGLVWVENTRESAVTQSRVCENTLEPDSSCVTP